MRGDAGGSVKLSRFKVAGTSWDVMEREGRNEDDSDAAAGAGKDEFGRRGSPRSTTGA